MPGEDLTMPDLIAFLNARLGEEEAAARAAGGWRWESDCEAVKADHGSDGVKQIGEFWKVPDNPSGGYISDFDSAAHAALHDPARVLREVAAKRALVEDHTGSCCVKGACCGEITDMFDSDSGDPCPVLLILAAVYSDHPDCRPEWKGRPMTTDEGSEDG